MPSDLPFLALPGQNKYRLSACPFCKQEGDGEDDFNNRVFRFRDHLSAREYQISGLCQTCQDKVFSCE